MILSNKMSLTELAALCASRLNSTWGTYVLNIPSLELRGSVTSTLQNSGKHLRPMLIYATGCIFDAPIENLDAPACAVELMHTYSLVHDDLPCMDNADVRRGKPSCHKTYGEGMAVLTGDALQTLAFQILASHPMKLKADKRVQMLQTLCHACGPYGMAAGQALDISMQEAVISDSLLLDIYKLKTGALFSASIELGYLASSDDDVTNQKALREFADRIGLAFQIQDDVLDIQSSSEFLGKPQGIDEKNNKTTYPKLHGIQAAKDKVQALYQAGLESIDYLGQQAQLLRELVTHMLDRER
jgi:farnesyl diphosphate synthase